MKRRLLSYTMALALFAPPLTSPVVAASGPVSTSMFGAENHMLVNSTFFSTEGPYWDPQYTIPVQKTLSGPWIRDGVTAYTNTIRSLVYLPTDSASIQQAVVSHRAVVDAYMKQYDNAGFRVIFTILALAPNVPNYAAYNANFQAWVTTLLQNHPSIYALELHNEPSSNLSWRGTAQDYVTVYKPFADASHQVRPDVKVLGCGGCSVYLAKAWVDATISAGMLNFVDGISLHPYNGANIPPEYDQQYGHGTWEDSQIYQYNYFQSQNPASRPPLELDFTEMGYSSVLGSIDSTPDEPTQAAYLSRLEIQTQDLKAGGAVNLNAAMWYDFKNDEDPTKDVLPNIQHNFGLYSYDLSTSKQSFTAYQTLIQALPNSSDITRTAGVSATADVNPTAVLYKYWQRKSDGATIVPYWRTDHTKTVTADFPGHIQITMPSTAAAAAVKTVTLQQICGKSTSAPFTVNGNMISVQVSFNLCASLAILK